MNDSWNVAKSQQIIDKWQNEPGALLPLLTEVLDTFGYVDRQIIPLIAKTLNIATSQVYGTITFYHEFRDSVPLAKHLQVCCAEACQSMGSNDLVLHLQQRGLTIDSDNNQQEITVSKVYCLGNCACAPAAVYQSQVYGRVSTTQLDSWVDAPLQRQQLARS